MYHVCFSFIASLTFVFYKDLTFVEITSITKYHKFYRKKEP